MAAILAQCIPSFAFIGYAGLRASSQHTELWNVALAGGTTAFTITCAKITNPKAYMTFLNDDGSVVALTATVTPLASGTSTLAFTGGTSGKTYTVAIRGTV